MGWEEVLNVLTLVALVAAVLVARHKSRQRLENVKAEAYASGMRDLHARIGASVVVGDITNVRGDGSTLDQRTVDQRTAAYDRAPYDIGAIDQRPGERAASVGHLRDAGNEVGGDRMRELPRGRRVGGGDRSLRLARSAVRRRATGADDAALTEALAVELGVDPVTVLDSDEALSVMRRMRDDGERLVECDDIDRGRRV